MYFLVNASPLKPLEVATSNFADALVRSKAGICDGVPSTGLVLYAFVLSDGFFQNQPSLKNYFRNTIRVSNSLGLTLCRA